MKIKVWLFLCIFVFFAASCALSQPSPNLVKVLKDKDGNWQLLVDGRPYFIQGTTYTPVKIGEDPSASTMRNWMDYDDDHDGKNDFAYQTWVDKNGNNIQDEDEKTVGDFTLMKNLGINTIRLYHVASDSPTLDQIYKSAPSTALQFDRPVNKKLLQNLYTAYGIKVIMGNFLGSWTIGSGASWDEGTDYENPLHRENIKKSVRAMVLDNKDEPYVLMWLLGNENNISDWSKCNAKQKPKAYATLVGELAKMIHDLDPNHPVAISEGDAGINNEVTLKLYAQYASDIDIIAYNSYRGPYGFGNLWNQAKTIFDRPVFICEFGTQAYNIKKGEDEDFQDRYIRGCWQDILLNRTKEKGSGNSLGGVIFDWLDRWYMDGTPSEHNPGSKPWNTPDGIAHDEWWGIYSYGDGHDSLMRQERKVCAYLRSVWKREK